MSLEGPQVEDEAEVGAVPVIRPAGPVVAAFIGVAERGPIGVPVPVGSWGQFTTTFGDPVEGAHLAHAVRGHAVNGGARCYVTRLEHPADVASALEGLRGADGVGVVAAPDVWSPRWRGSVDAPAVQAAVVRHCEAMGDRVAVLDPPPSCSAGALTEWLATVPHLASKQAALYWPWVRTTEPGTGATVTVPPSGHVAGAWARSDAQGGVAKAPANLVLRGVAAPEVDIASGEQDLLTPLGVNCIRRLAGGEIRVWGARTLSADPAWRQLATRRLVDHLERSIIDGTPWVAHVDPVERRMATLRSSIAAFLYERWRSGVLTGATAEQAFSVRCDSGNNPPEAVGAGRVAVDVEVASGPDGHRSTFRLSWSPGGAEIIE